MTTLWSINQRCSRCGAHFTASAGDEYHPNELSDALARWVGDHTCVILAHEVSPSRRKFAGLDLWTYGTIIFLTALIIITSWLMGPRADAQDVEPVPVTPKPLTFTQPTCDEPEGHPNWNDSAGEGYSWYRSGPYTYEVGAEAGYVLDGGPRTAKWDRKPPTGCEDVDVEQFDGDTPAYEPPDEPDVDRAAEVDREPIDDAPEVEVPTAEQILDALPFVSAA